MRDLGQVALPASVPTGVPDCAMTDPAPTSFPIASPTGVPDCTITQPELVALLTCGFYENFADEVAVKVLDADAVGLLYGLVTDGAERLPRGVRHKVWFRGAYVLERIFFDPGARERFMPFAGVFCRRDFVACTDPSARRHFTKIMAVLLGDYDPGLPSLEAIAEAAAEWAVDPTVKVAVRIWAVEVLRRCRRRVEWVDRSWDDLMGAMETGATPGIRCRMHKSWKKRE